MNACSYIENHYAGKLGSVQGTTKSNLSLYLRGNKGIHSSYKGELLFLIAL
jgi:hypothetical protein